MHDDTSIDRLRVAIATAQLEANSEWDPDVDAYWLDRYFGRGQACVGGERLA